jgi:ribosomal protein S6E (S10)
MPTFRMNVSVKQKGTIFSASKTKAQASRMVISINDALAQEGVNRVKARLRTVLQNPTGYYESRIAVERRQVYRGVWDQNVIYGGWLEGVTARNRTTRFKGYHTFRLVRQQLNADSTQLAQPLVKQFVNDMSN